MGSSGRLNLALVKGKDVMISGEISGGTTSTVYLATMDGSAVAAKRVRIGTQGDLERFRKELAMLAMLDGTKHVVGLRGDPTQPRNALTTHQ